MSLLAFALQVLPVSLLAFGATALGASLRVGETWRLPLLLVGILLYAALLTFRETTHWNLALLLALAAAAGALLSSFFGQNAGSSWGSAVVMTLAILAISLAIGAARRGRSGRVGKALWILAWIYLAGWLLLILCQPELWLQALWAGGGVVIFGGLIVVWSANLEAGENPGRGLAVRPGSDLYLLALSVALAAQLLLQALAGL